MDTFRQTESAASILKYDVAITGGGMVGMTLALALAKNPELSIVILESNEDNAPFLTEQYHHRVSAAALSSVRIFQSLQVWQNIKMMRVSPFTAIQVWDCASPAQLDFVSNEIGEPVLGYIIENNVMQHALREKLKAYPQIHFVSPVKLTACLQQEDDVTLIADDDTQYRAKLAVAADGAQSWLRQQAGISVQTTDYDQHAIVAAVETELPHQKIARQVFLPSGPLAFLPLADAHTSSIVWSLPKDRASALKEMDEDAFKLRLGAAFNERLGAVKSVSRRFTFPLKKQQAETYAAGRIVLVGDAAHVMHPLAGQGLNIGLLDAACLAEVILDALNAGRDFAGTSSLRRYERWRRADNLAMLTGVDLIKQLFASDNMPVQTMRSLGMTLTGRMAILKNIFTRYAVGSRDGLPSLAL
ncbi:MAG TPA: UbiH/UbiF/VisC/COQ6 family ubiquinone biosynthesis hydroxylase [Gammaproteobacteria bacterium]|nr:UbiH/UbiF/VisC/COQ6 family ubiquinone biosynthesis hydroxylase [Gammaproteobacteria bacterium]